MMKCKINKILKLFIVFFIFTSFSKKSFGQNELFSEFLTRFSQDSAFQMQRVSFPIKLLYIDDENFLLDSILLSFDNYIINRFHYNLIDCSEAYPIIYSNFKCEDDDISDERVFRWKGFSGMDERYYFRREKEKWWLIRIEILGT